MGTVAPNVVNAPAAMKSALTDEQRTARGRMHAMPFESLDLEEIRKRFPEINVVGEPEHALNS